MRKRGVIALGTRSSLEKFPIHDSRLHISVSSSGSKEIISTMKLKSLIASPTSKHTTRTPVVSKTMVHPRTKKDLGPPPKKRKVNPSIPEITFDSTARADYLTGFHKRKVQRIKHSQDNAIKRAKEEKIEQRADVRYILHHLCRRWR